MLLEEMIEYIRQHFPNLSESEIVRSINIVGDNFSKKTEILQPTSSTVITSDTRYYTLDNTYHIIRNVSIEESDGSMTEIGRAIKYPVKGA
jgi:5'(3')-deoxyribonucleotidase